MLEKDAGAGAFLPKGQRRTLSQARPTLFTDEFGKNPEFTHLRKKEKNALVKKNTKPYKATEKNKKGKKHCDFLNIMDFPSFLYWRVGGVAGERFTVAD